MSTSQLTEQEVQGLLSEMRQSIKDGYDSKNSDKVRFVSKLNFWFCLSILGHDEGCRLSQLFGDAVLPAQSQSRRSTPAHEGDSPC